MKRKINTLLLLCVTLLLLPLVLFSSCENEISYHGWSVPPKLNMNGFIYIDSLTNRLYLDLTGEASSQPVGATTVEVTVNGEYKQSVQAIREENERFRIAEITTRFRPGDLVRIDARTEDGKHHAWVEETIPQPVEIERIDTVRVFALPEPYRGYASGLRFNVHFQDRPNEKNYYRIIFEQKHTLRGKTEEGSDASWSDKSFGFWSWDDIALTDGRPASSDELDVELFERPSNIYGVFDDSWFRDSEYTLNALIGMSDSYTISLLEFVPEYWDMDVVVRLLSITESEYYYLNTMNVIDSGVLEDYISDPVKIPSNVHGGTGIVGISSESSKQMELVRDGKVDYYDDWR